MFFNRTAYGKWIEIGHLNDKIDSLEKENAALKIENTGLKDENDLLNSVVLYTDGTVVTENGKQAIIRNVSNKQSVMYTALENKKISAIPYDMGY